MESQQEPRPEEQPEEEIVAEEETVEEPVEEQVKEPFTLERGREQAAEAVERVKQASKEITTRPVLDAIGSYFTRGVDALIGLADGMAGKSEKKKDKE